jgi:hypothetical protein
VNIPDLHDEIERKTINAFYELADDYETKKISLHAYLVSIKFASNALRGLVDEEVMQSMDYEYNRLEPVYIEKMQAMKSKRTA